MGKLTKADLKPGMMYRIPGAWERGHITHKHPHEMTRAELRSVLHDLNATRTTGDDNDR